MVDRKCPYYEWLFDDAMRSSAGDHYCKIHETILDAMIGSMGQALCNHDNHLECPRYLKQELRMAELEKERDKIVNLIGFGD